MGIDEMKILDELMHEIDDCLYYMKFNEPDSIDITLCNNIIAELTSIVSQSRRYGVNRFLALVEATGNALIDDLRQFTSEYKEELHIEDTNNAKTYVTLDKSGKYLFCWNRDKGNAIKEDHNVDLFDVIELMINFDRYVYGKGKDKANSTFGDRRWIMQFPYKDKSSGKRCVLQVIYTVRLTINGDPIIRIITSYPLYYERSDDRKRMFSSSLRAEKVRRNPNPGKINGDILMPSLRMFDNRL